MSEKNEVKRILDSIVIDLENAIKNYIYDNKLIFDEKVQIFSRGHGINIRFNCNDTYIRKLYARLRYIKIVMGWSETIVFPDFCISMSLGGLDLLFGWNLSGLSRTVREHNLLISERSVKVLFGWWRDTMDIVFSRKRGLRLDFIDMFRRELLDNVE